MVNNDKKILIMVISDISGEFDGVRLLIKDLSSWIFPCFSNITPGVLGVTNRLMVI